jgi:hypothetical protein
MKLIDILKELNVPKPEDAYNLSEPTKSPELSRGTPLVLYKYHFKNRKGNDISIETNFDTDKSEIYVVFYESDKEKEHNDDLKYGTKTGSGDMLKVLATVVEAVNRTAKDLGGMQNVRAIFIQSDDPQRFEVYAHYAKTLFPDFTVEKIGSWIEIANKKYKPTNKQLKEIGETTAEAYPLTVKDEGDSFITYTFKTDIGTNYRIVILKDYLDPDSEELIYIISFGVDKPGSVDFEGEVGDYKNIYRVMATVVKAVKDTIAQEELPVTKLEINPTKKNAEDKRRLNLYMKYIEKQMPVGSSVWTDGSESILVSLPN